MTASLTIELVSSEYGLATVTLAEVNHTVDDVTIPSECLVTQALKFLPWDQPDAVIKKDVRLWSSKIVNVYTLPMLVFIGVPANLLSMVVFHKHGLKDRINLCLFCLSFSDFMILVVHLFGTVHSVYSEVIKAPHVVAFITSKIFFNYLVIDLVGFMFVSSFLTAVIAFERCLCIVSPLRSQHIMSTKTMGAIIALVHVISLGGFAVVSLRWNVVCVFDPVQRTATDMIYSSPFFFRYPELVNFFEGTLYGIIIPGICLAGVTISTVITVIKLRATAAWRQMSSSAPVLSSRDISVTRMLIGLSIMFIVCTFPSVIHHAAVIVFPEISLSGREYNALFLLINIQQFCTYINSSLNSFVYFFFGSRYRETVLSMFKCAPNGTGAALLSSRSV